MKQLYIEIFLGEKEVDIMGEVGDKHEDIL